MTAKELIEELSKLPPDAPIKVWDCDLRAFHDLCGVCGMAEGWRRINSLLSGEHRLIFGATPYER